MKINEMVGAAVLSLALVTATTAAAQGQFQIQIDRDGVQFGPSLNPRQHGYEHAYREGADHGRTDRERGSKYKLNSKQYRDTADGYEGFMGDRGEYQAGYRDGYKAGYDRAYNGHGTDYSDVYGRTEENRNRWDQTEDPYAPRHWSASDLAYDVGYRDGVTSGRYDRGNDVRADYEHTEAYRRGNHGYGSGYGDSAAYQREYRTGFQRGYQDGYGRRR